MLGVFLYSVVCKTPLFCFSETGQPRVSINAVSIGLTDELFLHLNVLVCYKRLLKGQDLTSASAFI